MRFTHFSSAHCTVAFLCRTAALALASRPWDVTRTGEEAQGAFPAMLPDAQAVRLPRAARN
jgi:hypothetical protein